MNKRQNIDLIIDAAKRSGAEVDCLDSPKKVYKITMDGNSRYVFGSLIPLNSSVAGRLAKDKFLTKAILSGIGIKVPKGFLYSAEDNIELKLSQSKLDFPVVVKPNSAALGNLVFVNVMNIVELKKAIFTVLAEYKECLVEEYLGDLEDHRVLILDGKVIAACRRVAPKVRGDGVSSVETLVKKYNESRKKPLKEDSEYYRFLTNQRLNLNSIPEAGKIVFLRGNANVATGGVVEDVTDTISDYFKDLAITCISELGLRFGGVDILATDIKSASEYVVTEVNGLPSFDIHLEASTGRKIDVAPLIVAAMFK